MAAQCSTNQRQTELHENLVLTLKGKVDSKRGRQKKQKNL